MSLPEAATIEVANSAPKASTQAPAAPQKEADDLSSFLNATPDEFDAPPPRPAVKQENEAVASPAQAVAVPQHPAYLIEAAEALGISERVIAKLDSAELGEHVFNVQRKLSAAEANETRRPRQERKPVEDPVHDEDDDVLTYLEKDVGADPKLVGLLRKKFKRLDELETGIKANGQKDAQRRLNENSEAIDAAIQNLGPKYEKIFGKGSIDTVSETCKARRLSVASAVDLFNDSPRVAARKAAQAAITNYADLIAEEQVKPAAPTPAASEYTGKPNGKQITPEEWDRGTVARPTGTRASVPRGAKAAAAALRDRMEEMGIHRGANDDEFDGLPN